MSLPQADKVGHSFPSQPLLLMRNPLPPSQGSRSTSTQTAESFDQAPSLASHSFDAEHPPHLPCEDGHLSLFTSLAPSLSPLQQLLVPCPRGGKVVGQEVNIFRCLSPCSKDPPAKGGEGVQFGLDRTHRALRDSTIESVNGLGFLSVLSG